MQITPTLLTSRWAVSHASPLLLATLFLTAPCLLPMSRSLASPKPYVVDAIHLREPTRQELRFKTLADEAYSQGDLAETLRQLRRAYQVRKNPRYLANQGLVLADFARYREAVELLERFIQSDPPIPKLKAAQAEIAILKPEVAITSEPPGAELLVSRTEERLGVTPFKKKLVSGEYRITLKKEGYDPLRVTLFVSPGKPVVARYVLNSQLVLTGPPPPSALGLAGEARGELRPLSRDQRSSERFGPRALSALSAGAALISAFAYLFTREALIERDSSLTSADWSRAQGESEAFYQVSVASAGLASLRGLGALGWWLHSSPD